MAGSSVDGRDYNSIVLSGAASYVNVLALITTLVALPLFIGSRRRAFFDRNNLLAFTLLGLAAFLHGGFQTILRASPYATFSGYLLGWSGGSEADDSSVFIYDLGFPPSETVSFPVAPYRELQLARSSGNEVAHAFWTAQNNLYLKCTYRTWDLRITDIDAVPTPEAKQTGLVKWQWHSNSERLFWPLLEAFIGLCIACESIFFFAKAKQASNSISTKPVRAFPARWAVHIYVTVILMLVAWVGFVRLSDRYFQYRVEVLLRNIKSLELRQSTWQEAERIRASYAKHVTTEAPCSPAHCDFSIILNHFVGKDKQTMAARIERTAWKLAGGRWAIADAMVRVRDGIIWGKDFEITVPHRMGYPLIASARTTKDFSHFGFLRAPARNRHANLRFGRPGGCEICEARWADVTPYASTDEVRDAFTFDLSCIGGTLRKCTEMRQIMPIAARELEEGALSVDNEATSQSDHSPETLRSYGRDAHLAALAEVARIPTSQPGEPGDVTRCTEYTIIETLKGKFESRVKKACDCPQVDSGLPTLHQKVIVLWDEREACVSAQATRENQEQVRAGVVEDSIDIPSQW